MCGRNNNVWKGVLFFVVVINHNQHHHHHHHHHQKVVVLPSNCRVCDTENTQYERPPRWLRVMSCHKSSTDNKKVDTPAHNHLHLNQNGASAEQLTRMPELHGRNRSRGLVL